MAQTHNSLLEQDLGVRFKPIHLERESLPGITSEKQDYVQPVWDFKYVRTLKQLEDLAKKLNRTHLFSLDTETSGTESTEPLTGKHKMTDLSLHLEVAQIGIPKITKTKTGFKIPEGDPTKVEGTTYLVDVRALKAAAAKKAREIGEEVNPIGALREPCEDEGIAVAIQHAAFEDGQFTGKYQVPINGVLDTEKIAKRFRPKSVDSNPLGPLMVSYSLGALSLEILSRPVNKDAQKGPWNIRNNKGYFPEKLEAYARLDAEETIYVLIALLQFEHYVAQEVERIKKDNNTQGILQEYRLALLERERLYEDSKIADAAFFLEASAQKYEENLKKVVLPLLHEEQMQAAKEQGEESEGIKYEHKTVYGSAYRTPKAYYKLNWDKLAEIDPALVEELRPEPSVTQGAIEKAIDQLEWGETHSAKQIWEEIRIVTGKRTNPSLKIALTEPVKGRSVTPFKKQVSIPEDWDVDDHLQAIVEARVNKLALLREAGVANQLGIVEMKLNALREALLESLIKEAEEDDKRNDNQKPNTSWPSEGEVGKVSFSTNAQDDRNIEKLVADYPEIAEIAVKRDGQPSKTAVEDAIREKGYEPEQAKELADSVFEVAKYGRTETSIFPKYGLFYKGPDDEFLDSDGNLIEPKKQDNE